MSTRFRLDRGLLVTFEGPDGSGKSTLSRGCLEHLSAMGIEPLGLFREPGQSAAGRRIRELSRAGRAAVSPEEELALFIEDRRWDVETNLRPILEQRGVVLLDRYYHSSIAYQGARGLNPEEIRRLNEGFAPLPDLVILLRLGVEACLERIQRSRGGRPDLFEERQSLERVCGLFDGLPDPQIRRFDASLPLDVLQSQINAAVSQLVEAHRL